MIKIAFASILGVLFSSCTLSFNIVQTDGKADDVVDMQQSPTTDATLDIPLH